MKVNLVVAHGTREGKVIPVPTERFVIGRDPQCQLRPASDAVSKQHCALVIKNERLFIKDLGSKNGTLVNDQRIDSAVELKNGDRLKIGPLAFVVKLEKEAARKSESSKSRSADDDAASILLEDAGSHGSTSGPPSDRIAAMLLDLSGETTQEDQIPTGTTAMDLPAVAVPESGDAKEPEKPGTAKNQPEKPKTADTASAAKAILEKYSRRLRP